MQAELINRRLVLHYLLQNDLVLEPARPAVTSFLRHNNSLPGTTGRVEYAGTATPPRTHGASLARS
jgi:hypothetical protein